MENKATSGNFGPGTTGMTLQAAVFAGLVDPGNLVGRAGDRQPRCRHPTPVPSTPRCSPGRSPATPSPPGTKPGQVIVSKPDRAPVAPQKVSDGIDTLTNIERLQFTDGVVALTPPDAPTGVSAVAGNALGVRQLHRAGWCYLIHRPGRAGHRREPPHRR